MSSTPVIRLVKSLSSSEKRHFKLQCKKQSGDKDYLDLFDLIDKTDNPEISGIREKYKELYPHSSLDNAGRYLVKVLTDCLIQSKMDKDVWFQLLQGMMRVRVLQERSLPEEGYRQLKKLRRTAQEAQHHFIEYLTYRQELNYFTEINFDGICDKKLVEKQMKAKSLLKTLNQIQDHYSLFELLKYRAIHSGKISSDEERKKLNDLMLSEMVLVADKAKSSFTAQKLHLLFQSSFFTNTSDYYSALKTFYELNKLFEQNQHMLDHPPLDYLSGLEGILYSLHLLGRYEELGFYIDKMTQLDQAEFPEYFRYLVRKTTAIYRLVSLTGKNQFDKAVAYIQSLDPSLFTSYSMINEEKQWELYFYCSLAYFGKKDLKKAHTFIREAMNEGRFNPQLHICKALRLLNIIIHCEKGDILYLEYEIRSYKRFSRQHGRLLKSESLVLKVVEHLSYHKSKPSLNSKFKNVHQEISALNEDKYEKQLLTYFNFSDWVSNKVEC